MMNNEDSPNGPNRLRELLSTWQVRTPLPPRFQEQVWQRICRQEPPTWGRLAVAWDRLIAASRRLLGQPLGATAYVVLLLAGGILAGLWGSEQSSARREAAWRTAYVQAVSPLPTTFPAP